MNAHLPMTLGLAAFAALAAANARADADYSYENDGKTYVVTVATNTTEEISPGVVQLLNASAENGITNFVKRGAGTLTVSSDLKTFTGDLVVEAGEYQMIPPTGTNYALGQGSVDSVAYVKAGATLSLNVSRASAAAAHTVVFEGTGFGGIGAILIRKSYLQIASVVGTKWVLAGDALVVNKSSNLQGLLGASGKIDMRGHTLTYGGSDSYIRFLKDSDLIARNGDIVFASGTHQLGGKVLWLSGDHTLRVKKDTTLILNGIDEGSIAYTNVFESGSALSIWNKGAKNVFSGRTILETDTLPISNKDGGTVDVVFNNAISGGGFTVGKGVTLKIGLSYDYSKPYRNTFTNGIVATAGSQVRLFFGTYDSVPKNGAPIALTNATLWTRDGLTFHLPGIVLQDACEVIGTHDFDYNCVPNGSGGFTEKGTAENSFRNEKTLEFGAGADVAFSADVVVSNVRGLANLTNATTVADHNNRTGRFLSKMKIGYTWTIDTAQVVAGRRMTVRDQIDLCDGIQVRLTGTDRPKGRVRSFKVAEAGTGINWLGAKTLTVVDAPKNWKLRIGDDGKSLWADYVPNGFALVIR